MMKKNLFTRVILSSLLCLLSASAFAAQCNCSTNYDALVQANSCGTLSSGGAASSLAQSAAQLGAISTCAITNAGCNFSCALAANQATQNPGVTSPAPVTQSTPRAFGTNQPQSNNLSNSAESTAPTTTQKANKSISWF